MMSETTLIIRATYDSETGIYRDIEIPSSMSLESLAKGILKAYSFDMDHAFGFFSGLTYDSMYHKHPKYEIFADMGESEDSLSVQKTPVFNGFPDIGSKLMFLFDYGDEWLFLCEVIDLGEKVPRKRYPKCIKSVGKAPEQYPEFEDDE